MSKRKVVLIPGDGIGPNISNAVKKVVAASGAEIDWIERKAGLSALEEGLDVLPDSTIEAIKEHKVALKGPCTTSYWGGFYFCERTAQENIRSLRSRKAH